VITTLSRQSFRRRVSAFSPAGVAGLKVWLKADAIVGLADTDPVSTWSDSSGQGNDGTASLTVRPLYRTGIVNGKPVVRFDGVNDVLNLPNSFSAFTAGTAFVVVKIVTDPPTAEIRTGLWRFGAGITSHHYPYTDGTIYDAFGSTVRKTTGNPTPALTNWHVYEVVSKTNEWTSRINGTQHFTTATNTVGWTTTPQLGGQSSVNLYCQGDIAEFLLYDNDIGSTARVFVIC
jgi:hypothetical protein